MPDTESSLPIPYPKVVETRILADVETPLSAYWKLAKDEPYSFLLESVTGGEQVSRYSFLGVKPKLVIKTQGKQVVLESAGKQSPSKLEPHQDPLHLLQSFLTISESLHQSDMPPFIGGAVGLLSYDLIRFFENLPDSTENDLNVDDLAMMLTSVVVAFDHAKNVIRIMGIASSAEEEAQVKLQIEETVQKFNQVMPELPQGKFEDHETQSNHTQSEFEQAVERAKELITQGDGVQFVPSQRFKTKFDAHPVTLYRALRHINPSPYMFLVRLNGYDIIGASPELLVSLHTGIAHLRPIAGTRPRGTNEIQDSQLAEELLADEKERAEHVMLVDLARNDLGRVCQYGSVKVNDLMVIEKYSHVMHIVSDVTGKLDSSKNGFDLFRACFPAGTVSGAPKVRAMEVIDEIEPTRRGVYAGSVGFFSVTGDVDTCIAIRTIVLKDGFAYVQAGVGAVYDSVPASEYEESLNKAGACLRAIRTANGNLELK